MQSNPKEERISSARHLPQGGAFSRAPDSLSFFLSPFTLIATIFLVVSCQEKSTKPTSFTQTHISAETTLTLSLSDTTLPTSGMLTATLRAEHPESTHIEFPSTTADFGDFTVFESKDTPPALNLSGKITTACSYTLEPDLPGISTLPSLTTIILPDGGTPTEILTDPIPIEITSVLIEGETKSSDIVIDPYQTHVKAYTFSIPFRLFALILSILAISAFFIIRRFTKPTNPPTTQPFNETLPENLSDLPPASMLIVMEPHIARIISRRHGIAATDFTSLEKSNIPGLAPLIARHRKLSYSDSEPTETEAAALLADFKTFLRKEAT